MINVLMDLWSRKISNTTLPQQKWSHLQKLYKNDIKDVKISYKEQDDENLDMWLDILIKAKKIGLCMKYWIRGL